MRLALLTAALTAATFSGSALATITAGDVSTSPSATGVITPITYAPRAGISGAEFRATLTDASNVVATGVDFQIFNTCPDDGLGGCAAPAWVSCSTNPVNVAVVASPVINGSCSQNGESANYSLVRTGGTMGAISSGMRVVYSIEASATDSQTATFGFGPYCTGIDTAATTGCTALFDGVGARDDAPNPATVTVDGTTTVLVSANRTLAFNPVPGTTISFGPGAVGSTPSQDIVVTASGNVGTATVTGCAISGAGASSFSVSPPNLTFNGTSMNPQSLAVGCTIPSGDASATLTCTQTDQGGSPTQRQWPLSCAPAPATPDVTASPAGGNVAVGGGSVGATGFGQVAFSATGGAGSGSASIACSVTAGPLQLAFGSGAAGASASQTVTGSATPLNLSFSTVLTDTAQPAVGTFQCVIDEGGVTETLNFSVAAPAGSTFTPPAVIPASSLWSQLALIALFLGLGGVVLVVRRNG